MAELGLQAGSKKNEWQQEAERTGIVRPTQRYWAPTSESGFDRRLGAAINEFVHHSDYEVEDEEYEHQIEWDDVHPDVLWQKGSNLTPFIYYNGKMHTGYHQDSHSKIIIRMFNMQGVGVSAKRRVLEADGALLGRVGDFKQERYASFWDEGDHSKIPECLKSLYNSSLIDEMTVIVVTGQEPRRYQDAVVSTQRTPEQERKMQLARELHLMRPDEKKAAMRELGLAPGSKKRPWQQEAENTNLVRPGQKWWGLTSEAKDPSYDPKHPEECCPSCGARQERGDDGDCNRCGEPWPEDEVPGELVIAAKKAYDRIAPETPDGDGGDGFEVWWNPRTKQVLVSSSDSFAAYDELEKVFAAVPGVLRCEVGDEIGAPNPKDGWIDVWQS